MRRCWETIRGKNRARQWQPPNRDTNMAKSEVNDDRSSFDVAAQRRLNEAREAGIPWKKWGPYLSERQWGTVREDYSGDGDALELLQPRSLTLTCISLGRGRTR